MNNLDKHAANKHFLKAHRHLTHRMGALLLALTIALAPTVSERAVYAEEAPAEQEQIAEQPAAEQDSGADTSQTPPSGQTDPGVISSEPEQTAGEGTAEELPGSGITDPAGGNDADGSGADDSAVQESPVEDQPAEEKPVEKKPAEEEPADTKDTETGADDTQPADGSKEDAGTASEEQDEKDAAKDADEDAEKKDDKSEEVILYENDAQKRTSVKAEGMPADAEMIVSAAPDSAWKPAVDQVLQQDYEALLALDISFAEAALPDAGVKITIQSPLLTEGMTDEAILFHINKNGQAEKVAYGWNTAKKELQFSSRDFSPFAVVVPKAEEPEEEPSGEDEKEESSDAKEKEATERKLAAGAKAAGTEYTFRANWNDWDDFYGNRPDTVKAHVVYSRNPGKFDKVFTLSKENNYEATITVPDKADDGSQLAWYYYVETPATYSSSNTVNWKEGETDYTYTVKAATGRHYYRVSYNDDFDRYYYRTNKLKLQYTTADDTPMPPGVTKSPVAVNIASNSNGSGNLFLNDFPKYGYNGKEIIYDLNLTGAPAAYTVQKSTTANSSYLNNKYYQFTLTLPTTNFKTKVVWVDDDNYRQRRPSDVVLTLYANGEPWNPQVRNNRISPAVTTQAGYTWQGLPAVDKNGNRIEWSVRQNALAIYDTTYEGVTYAAASNTWNETVTNVYRDDWNYSIDLQWDTSNASQRFEQNIYTTSTGSYRVKYALNIITNAREYEIGELSVRLPYALWKSRNGSGLLPTDISVPQWPKKNSQYSFSYQIDKHDSTDPTKWEIVYVNNEKLEMGTNQTLTVIYDVSPGNTIDLSTAHLVARGSAKGDGQSDYEEKESREITLHVDTGVYLSKSASDTKKVDDGEIYSQKTLPAKWQDGLMEELDFSKYHYAVYVIQYGGGGNQPHETVIEETPSDGGRIFGVLWDDLWMNGNNKNRFLDKSKTVLNIENADGSYTSKLYRTISSDVSKNDRVHVLVGYPIEDKNGDPIPPTGERMDTWHYKNTAKIKVHASDDNNYFEHPEIDDRYDYDQTTISASCEWVEYRFNWDGEIYNHSKYQSWDTSYSLSQLQYGSPVLVYSYLNFTVNGYELDSFSTDMYDCDMYWNITTADGYSDYIRMTPDDYELYSVYFTSKYTDIDRVDGETLPVTENLPEEPLILWAKTAAGEWEKLGEWKHTTDSLQIPTQNNLPSGYTGVRLTTPETGPWQEHLYISMGIRIKPDSPQLKEWFAKRDAGEISFSQVNILNIASYKLLLPDENGEMTWVNKAVDNQCPAAENVGLTDEDIEAVGAKVEHNSYVYSLKEATFADQISKRVVGNPYNDTVHSKVDVTFDIAAAEYTEWRNVPQAMKEAMSMEDGIFYDLLPKGYEIDLSKGVRAQGAGNERFPAVVTQTEVIDNWRGTNRQMCIFHVKSMVGEGKNVGENIYSIGTGYKLIDRAWPVATGFAIEYTASIPWSLLGLYKNGTNFVGFQAENARPLYTAQVDDGKYIDSYSIFGNSVQDLKNPATGEYYLRDLNEDGVTNVKDTMVTYETVRLDVAQTVEIGILKEVKGLGGFYTDKDYTGPGDTYSYRIKLTTSDGGSTKNIILYDVLEDAANKEGHTGETYWRGTFADVRTNIPFTQGANPVIYYSTAQGLDYNDITDPEKHMDISNAEIWTTEKPANKDITAIAIDLRKRQDGKDFVFKDKNSTYVDIIMTAPEERPEELYAYNRPAYTVDYIPSGSAESMMNSNIGSRVQIKFVEPQKITIHKTGEDFDATGKKTVIPLPGVYFQLYKCDRDHEHKGAPGASGSCWGSPVQYATSGEDGLAVFDDLLTGTYAVKEARTRTGFTGSSGYWTFTVDAEEGTISEPVRKDNASALKKEEDGSYTLLNTRTLVTKRVRKTWVGASGVKLPQITFDLYRNGQLYRTVTQAFANNASYSVQVPEYDMNGARYNYEFKERPVEGFTSKVTYNSSYSRFEAVNTYASSGTCTLEAEKMVNDRPAKGNEVFTFVLEKKTGDKWVKVEEVSNEKEDIQFAELKQSCQSAGTTVTEIYRVSEKDEEGSLYEMDKAVLYAVIKWTDKKNHTMEATVEWHKNAADGAKLEEPVFHNYRTPLPATGGTGTMLFRILGIVLAALIAAGMGRYLTAGKKKVKK